jgi:glc operon protein GlcG
MTLKFKSTLTAIGLTVLAATAAQAQQPTARDTVPEKMPFDVPYGAPISLDRAETVLNAAVAESKTRGWKLICAVVDSGGNLVSLKRMDNGQLASIDIASHKARTAVKFRRETKIFENGVQEGGLPYLLTLDDVIASRGGIPLVEGGKMIGAIGCSGGTGSQDEVVAKAGVAALK